MAALGRPREEEGVALGKPKDGEGNLESETAEGKPLMCSLSTEREKKTMEEIQTVTKQWAVKQVIRADMQKYNTLIMSATIGPQVSQIHPPDRVRLGEKAALWLLC